MTYYFILGRSRELSRAELESVLNTFGYKKFSISLRKEFLLLDIKEETDVMQRIFNRLGGFLSFGIISKDIDEIVSNSIIGKKKIIFGLSIYTDQFRKYSQKEIKNVLDSIKDSFSSQKISSRYIVPNGLKLDTGQIVRSKMLENGFEVVILEDNGTTYYGKTLGVQDINLYSEIEYDKPYTDKDMGVLPAKLCKILINLAGLKEGSTIWDPFCGSGTVVLMSLLSGYNALGSDIDQKNIDGTLENIKWLIEKEKVGDLKYQCFPLDILKPERYLLTDLKRTDVDAIVCEPYMGPPQYRLLNPNAAKRLLNDVEELYKQLFYIIDETKKRDSTLVIIVPSYKTLKGWMSLSLNSILPKRWVIQKINDDEDLHWKRSNSIIKRNIFVIKAKAS